MSEPVFQLISRDGRIFWVGPQGLTIGRSQSNDVVIKDPKVSRRHATLRVAAGRCWVRDENSAHGVFINEKQVDGQQEMKVGDVLQIGPVAFRSEVAEAAKTNDSSVRAGSPKGRKPIQTISIITAVTIVLIIVLSSVIRIRGLQSSVGGYPHTTGSLSDSTPDKPGITPSNVVVRMLGDIDISEGIRVNVPEYALLAKETISITVGMLATPPPLPPEADGILVSNVYNFEPDGKVFEMPIEITIPYNPEKLPPDMAEEDFVLLNFDGNAWTQDENGRILKCDPETKLVTFSTLHFSAKAIGIANSQSLDDPAEVQFDKAWKLYFWGVTPMISDQVIREFQKVVDLYPESPWAIRSLYFLGKVTLDDQWVFGVQSWEESDYGLYRENLAVFDQGLAYLDQFLAAPDQGPPPCALFCNVDKYKQHDDVQALWANYVPYGIDVYRYLEAHNWFAGNGMRSEPLPIMAAANIRWAPQEDAFDRNFHTAFMSYDELPVTIQSQINQTITEFGSENRKEIRISKQVASEESFQFPAMVDAAVSIFRKLKIVYGLLTRWYLGVEDAIYQSVDEYIAATTWPKEQREGVRGGVRIAHYTFNILVRSISEMWTFAGSVTIDWLQSVEGKYLGDVSFEDLPRGYTYAFSTGLSGHRGPAFVIFYQLEIWDQDNTVKLIDKKFWVLQNVNANELAVDDDPVGEAGNPRYDKNWEPYFSDTTIITFPLIRFQQSLPETISINPDGSGKLDLAVEYKLDKPTEREAANGSMVVKVQGYDASGTQQELYKQKYSVPKLHYNEKQGLPIGNWHGELNFTVPIDLQTIRLCLELYDVPNPRSDTKPATLVCSDPIMLEGTLSTTPTPTRTSTRSVSQTTTPTQPSNPAPTKTPTITLTLFPTSIPTKMPTMFPTSSPTLIPTKTQNPDPDVYYPIPGCAASRLHVGDSIMLESGIDYVGIRSTPDTHPSDNKIGRIEGNHIAKIIGGPECNNGWILWEVLTDDCVEGWIPEGDGNEFWVKKTNRTFTNNCNMNTPIPSATSVNDICGWKDPIIGRWERVDNVTALDAIRFMDFERNGDFLAGFIGIFTLLDGKYSCRDDGKLKTVFSQDPFEWGNLIADVEISGDNLTLYIIKWGDIPPDEWHFSRE